jgi:hypothetical protein
MECSARHRFDADSHPVLVWRPQPGIRGATTEDRDLLRMGYRSSDTRDEDAPAFMIGRPALIGLKSHAFAEAQPTELAPLAVQKTMSPSNSAKLTGRMIAMPSAT